MPSLFLHGDHYEMGLQHGLQVLPLRPRIVQAIEWRLERLSERTGVQQAFEQVMSAWELLAPSTLAMLRGMAEGLEMDLEHLQRYAVASYLDDLTCEESVGSSETHGSSASEGCTVWAVAGAATRDGSPILSKNRDYELIHLPLQGVAYAEPEHGYSHACITSAGSPAVFSSGMNEQGLAVADTHVRSRDLGPGVARYSLMMELLEKCASTLEALQYLADVRHMGAGSLVLLDAHGEIALCESAYHHPVSIRPDHPLVVSTNHFVSDSLSRATIDLPPGTILESQVRHQAAQTALEQTWGAIDVDFARNLMRQHENGEAGLCRHPAHDKTATISSVIFLPSEQRFLFCNGQPCQGTWDSFTLPPM